MRKLKFSRENEYYRKIEELTRVALERCAGLFMVGYTDLHGSLDCAADWRDPQLLCLDIFDCPANIQKLVRLANENFLPIFDHYDATLNWCISHADLYNLNGCSGLGFFTPD